jgi:uncharacterized protein (TIGR03435 family)
MFMLIPFAAITALCIVIGSGQAQPRDRPAAFDVASIKPSAVSGEGRSRSKIEYSGNSLTMRNVDLSDCITWAYQVEHYQMSGQDALSGNRYDILAKAAGAAPVSQLRLMLQQLLADRFKLSLRRDIKSLPIYALTVAKGGPKLPPVRNDGDGYHAVERLPRIQNDSFVFQDTSMPEFAAKLTILRGIDRPVVDKTGITGFFDIALKSAPSAMLQENGPSLFTLIQEQLGLKLVPEKAPMEVLVIDHVEKPSEN